MTDDKEALLRRIQNLVALRHQIDGSASEQAARREDLLECIAAQLTVAGYGVYADAL